MTTAALAISLTQPWAYFMLSLPPEYLKRIENRSWNTNVRRHVWVHAAKKMTRADYHSACDFAVRAGVPIALLPPLASLKLGGIVGGFSVTDVILPGGFSTGRVYPSGQAARRTHELGGDRWYMGKFGFVVEDARAVEFVPCAGALGFWRVPPAVLEQLGGGK